MALKLHFFIHYKFKMAYAILLELGTLKEFDKENLIENISIICSIITYLKFLRQWKKGG